MFSCFHIHRSATKINLTLVQVSSRVWVRHVVSELFPESLHRLSEPEARKLHDVWAWQTAEEGGHVLMCEVS